MRIDHKYKIEEAASIDESRWIITGVLLEPGKAVATDGRILAQVPVEMEEGEADALPFVVPSMFLKWGRPKPDFDVEGYLIQPDLRLEISGGKIAFSSSGISSPPILGNYPDYNKAVPDDSTTRPVSVRLNARYLLKLAEAIGSDEVEICIGKDDLKPVIIRPNKKNGATGVIMPCKADS